MCYIKDVCGGDFFNSRKIQDFKYRTYSICRKFNSPSQAKYFLYIELTVSEQAVHWGNASVVGIIVWNEERKPRIWCGRGPRQVASDPSSVFKKDGAKDPSGC